jgi:hypothetical protein
MKAEFLKIRNKIFKSGVKHHKQINKLETNKKYLMNFSLEIFITAQ